MQKTVNNALTAHTHFWQKIPRIGVMLFLLGLLGGIGLRLTIFLTPFGQNVINAVWYFGTAAYIIFYFFRILIEKHRREICYDAGFRQRLKDNTLTPEDVIFLDSMVASLERSKVLYNYIVWLALSVVSLIGALLLV